MKLIAQTTVFISAILIAGLVAINQTNAAQTTIEPVPGDPFSYTEKYQCPFYENVNEKGCQVPENLTCNADWTECHPKEVPAPVEVTPAPIHKPISGCQE